jgi:hypothetical protein
LAWFRQRWRWLAAAVVAEAVAVAEAATEAAWAAAVSMVAA